MIEVAHKTPWEGKSLRSPVLLLHLQPIVGIGYGHLYCFINGHYPNNGQNFVLKVGNVDEGGVEYRIMSAKNNTIKGAIRDQIENDIAYIEMSRRTLLGFEKKIIAKYYPPIEQV